MEGTGYNKDWLGPQRIAWIHKSIHKLLMKRGTKTPEELYHYTSIEVMDSILEHAQFWASNIFYLNDAEEYYSGISHLLEVCNGLSSEDPIAKRIEGIVKEIRMDNGLSSEGVFSISFSGQSDNLHQWITYAKEGGVCLGLDYQLFKKFSILLDTGDDNLYAYGAVKDTVAKAAYVDKVSIPLDKLKEEWETVYVDHDAPSLPSEISTFVTMSSTHGERNDKTDQSFLRLLACYFKNSAFQVEDEYRAVLLPLFFKHFPSPKINYKAMLSGVIRPYIKVGFYDGKRPKDRSLPIKSITVGPAGKQHAVFESVVHRIKYGNQKIWNYWDKSCEQFWENYLSYVSGALERYVHMHNEKITEDAARKIYHSLWKTWKEENQHIKDSPDEPENCDVYIKKLNDGGHIITGAGATEEGRILDYIKRNNYFSKEGIWISKSKISYVF